MYRYAEWMTKMSKEKVTAAVQLDEITDALGNVVEIKKPKKTNLSNKDKKKADKAKVGLYKLNPVDLTHSLIAPVVSTLEPEK